MYVYKDQIYLHTNIYTKIQTKRITKILFCCISSFFLAVVLFGSCLLLRLSDYEMYEHKKFYDKNLMVLFYSNTKPMNMIRESTSYPIALKLVALIRKNDLIICDGFLLSGKTAVRSLWQSKNKEDDVTNNWLVP